MDGLTEGRMVHYVLDRGPAEGEHRPAIVTKVCPPEWGYEDGAVQLTVFPDWSNDGFDDGPCWATSIHFSETKEPGTWHWIEPA